ncbi:m7GpppX diphosphatase [Adelges cooleyi]|uniref:m7GpppX diphosphatase n=1 Tax=Adelges cooleyi TaxID=133065 RepID=UPI0021802FBC|nr:m7GpppX diphosphatase [Adelges cooleyi]XP_050423660.1 m7GpppX diphosphatase [Adelges cooleyi]
MSEQPDFSKFQFKRILMNDTQRKMVAVEGNFNGCSKPAVIVMEKYAFDKASIMNVCSSGTKFTKDVENDVYKSFTCVPQYNENISSNKMDLIHPATQKHILKFSSQPLYIVQETKEMYQEITLPFILDNSLSLQWVYNCLEYTSEKERIKYDTACEKDKDDNLNGFLLIPDLKWSGKLDELYLLAIIKRRNIKSLRDLTSKHLPLLKNILNKGTAAIYRLYGVPLSQLRIYVHYQPSFYHFHVHFTYLMHIPPGINTEKAHLLSTVINNIELLGDYYQSSTMNFVIKEGDPLFSCFEDKGILSKSKLLIESIKQ